jgi:hypothetical protein
MTAPTETECLEAAAEIYGAILADPERAEQIRAHRARLAEQAKAEETQCSA